MAAMVNGIELSLEGVRQNESMTQSFECVKCCDLKEQLKILTLELESATAIISLLQEDGGSSTGAQPTLDYPL
jgi:hypothetical protein